MMVFFSLFLARTRCFAQDETDEDEEGHLQERKGHA
jgi:hypothetical protein